MGRDSSESSRSRYTTPMPNSSPFPGSFQQLTRGLFCWRTVISIATGLNDHPPIRPEVRTLAAASGWNEPSLITAFRQGLNPRLKSHLAAYDDTHGLEKFIQLAIRCSNRINIRPTDSTPAPAIVTPPNHQPEARDQPEAMLTDMFRLTTC